MSLAAHFVTSHLCTRLLPIVAICQRSIGPLPNQFFRMWRTYLFRCPVNCASNLLATVKALGRVPLGLRNFFKFSAAGTTVSRRFVKIRWLRRVSSRGLLPLQSLVAFGYGKRLPLLAHAMSRSWESNCSKAPHPFESYLASISPRSSQAFLYKFTWVRMLRMYCKVPAGWI